MRHPGKSPAQRRALDEIGCGNNSPIMAKATCDAMLRAGLIVELSPSIRPAGPFMMTVRQFEMPIPVHYQWCCAVSEEGDPDCTDCGGTGITLQTERDCHCILPMKDH